MDDQPPFASDTITVGGSTGEPAAPDFDPMLLSVLSSRFGAILREMSNGVLRASKSGCETVNQHEPLPSARQ